MEEKKKYGNKKNHEHKRTCNEECCAEECTCGDDCHCTEDDKCSENCTCGQPSKEDLLLNMARQIQAEFDNFRKRSYIEIENARQNGLLDSVKAILPAVDSIKKAKSMIKDEVVIKGLDMILSDITLSFASLGVEEIISMGQKLNPNLHNAVAVVNNENADDDIIVDEYQTGYKIKDKIIRYSQVIVNKKESK